MAGRLSLLDGPGALTRAHASLAVRCTGWFGTLLDWRLPLT
jgi:hypothetical protein